MNIGDTWDAYANGAAVAEVVAIEDIMLPTDSITTSYVIQIENENENRSYWFTENMGIVKQFYCHLIQHLY